jgi:hypothetical protein
MRNAKSFWTLGIGAVLAATLLVVCTGCDFPFSPNMDQIQSAFCARYPEVCQYVDFDN